VGAQFSLVHQFTRNRSALLYRGEYGESRRSAAVFHGGARRGTRCYASTAVGLERRGYSRNASRPSNKPSAFLLRSKVEHRAGGRENGVNPHPAPRNVQLLIQFH